MSLLSRGIRWRSSVWYATFVVFLGIACDLLSYSIIIPIIPFRLQKLGYKGVSGLVGWLIFAYSAGLVASTIPVALLSERYSVRRQPLILGLAALVGSQVLLMEAKKYWVMCVARVLQGVSSTVVWTVGLAMLCDTTHESIIGRQLGIATSGLAVGLLLGPPIGGILYERFGYRGPFIFAISATMLDLLARILLVERKDALKYGIDPARIVERDEETSNYAHSSGANTVKPIRPPMQTMSLDDTPSPPKTLSFVQVLSRLIRSSRALSALLVIFVYGAVYTAQEPVLPLYLQKFWHLDSEQVGIVLLVTIVPSILASPLTGWFTDNYGTEWITFVVLVLSLPLWPLIVLHPHLHTFVAAFAIECFFTSGVVAPMTAELAAVSRSIEGIGYAHVYGAFNLAYGIGTAVGPIIGSQIFGHVKHGWTIICVVSACLLSFSMSMTFIFIGQDPLFSRLVRRLASPRKP